MTHMTGPDANLTKKYRGLLRVQNNREWHIPIFKHEFYKTYIKTRVRFAARLLQAGVPVNDECS
jgi:hypothetical protein